MRIALTTVGLILGLMVASSAWAGDQKAAADEATTEPTPAVDAGPSDTPVAAMADAPAPEADDAKAADEEAEE